MSGLGEKHLETFDFSEYHTDTKGRLVAYESISPIKASIKRAELYTQVNGEIDQDDRIHNIRREKKGVTDNFLITRKTDHEEPDPRTFEDMHPCISLGGSYSDSEINLELTDPTVMIPQEDRIEESREIKLKSDDGVNSVEGTIRESGGIIHYKLSSNAGKTKSTKISKNIDAYLQNLTETTDIPDWEDLRNHL